MRLYIIYMIIHCFIHEALTTDKEDKEYRILILSDVHLNDSFSYDDVTDKNILGQWHEETPETLYDVMMRKARNLTKHNT